MTDQAVEPAATGPSPHPFTGRGRELSALCQDIERVGLHTLSGQPPPHCRILLIAGAPGAGRTALAEEFVRRVADRYPGGVLRARLTDPGGAPVPTERTARDLLAAMAGTGTPGTGTPGQDASRPRQEAAPAPGADEAAVAEAFRAALTRRGATVLLLDDVADSEQLLDLVPASRDCLVVAVATGPLTDVPDVRPCTLGGLERAASVALLARYAGSSPRFTVDPRSAETLAERCGDLPAALTLMGGWLASRPMLSVLQAAQALSETAAGTEEAEPQDGGFEGRETDGAPAAAQSPAGPGTEPEEAAGSRGPSAAGEATGAERTTARGTPEPLVRAFQLVHGSLPRSSARLLRLLALAPAGCVDPQTASSLGGCSVSTACLALDEFVRLGLLRALGGDRYQVPGCLDPLLRAELAVHERPAEAMLARARMLERLVRQLQACRAVCEPAGSPGRARMAGTERGLRFAHRAEARSWLQARRPALLAAARMAVAEGGGELDTLARRLVSALARAFDAHRDPEEAAPELYRLHELVLRVAERGGRHRERAAALLNLGDLDADTDRFEDALVRYRAALDAAREGEDEWAAGRAMESLAGCYAELEDWERAADWYGRALALRLTRGERADREAAARLHGRIGAVHTYAEHWDEALRAWRASAAAFRRLREPAAQARALAEVARVQECAGRPHEALRSCDQALAAARGAGDGRLEGALELRAAGVCERSCHPGAARRHRAAAERLLGTLPPPRSDGAAAGEACGDGGGARVAAAEGERGPAGPGAGGA
ncbi:tetratricopeptide repeat protein [Streptomyces tubbatahanensis]|uniref:Tetratricopeptide repeat protein n=1 Tax=Streptomyces tubbatahanensis TaxID=2923272 RepID=A0ABY3XP60_9ACTN|nr:tetratricopeptide repeat protein [Streptomyces tubbatahanensis]UNS96252.1 tetratricopeptide repeat protein [Streptomyces tubbatahanensis]